MSSIQGFNFDKEELDSLLEYFERGQMSETQAQQLKLMLEDLHRGFWMMETSILLEIYPVY